MTTINTNIGGSLDATTITASVQFTGSGAGLTSIPLSALATLTANQVVVTDGSGVLTSTATVNALRGGTGLDTSASTGVAKVSAGTWSVSALVNADVDAAAAIAFSKMAALTASQVVVTNGSGVISTAATLSTTLGGTGQDFSGIGAGPFVPTISSGVFSATLTYAQAATASTLVQRNGSGDITVAQVTATTVNCTALASTGSINVTSSGSGNFNLGTVPLRQAPTTVAGGAFRQLVANVQTTDATVTTALTFATTTDVVYGFRVIATWGQIAPATTSAIQNFLVRAYNDGGTVTVSGLADNTKVADGSLSPVGVAVSVSVSGTNVLFRVTGIAQTLRWALSIDVIEQSLA